MLSKPVFKYISIALIAVGAMLIIIAALVAFLSFYGYRVPEMTGISLEESITRLVYALVDIAVRLGFLGVMVWAGSILLKHGIQSMKSEAPQPSK